ncbi:hypothetical protein [Salinibaculum rarum]|uniref:hypothetical protein n=1 Tax=Salinibaculum rarum TaxID=3058903 RepID=UPI00265E2247|nr:hypothetical protein [Salinibaculum sp. KK48]
MMPNSDSDPGISCDSENTAHDLPVSNDELDRVLRDIYDNPNKYDAETLLNVFTVLSGVCSPDNDLHTPFEDSTSTTEPDGSEPQSSTDPVIPVKLIVKRARVYHDKGVDALHALRLALDDAIDTVDQATEQDHTGPVGGLVSQ